VIVPVDPNEKYGPAGTGDDRLVSRSEVLPYQISFENMAEAGFTVQEVVVVDYLDPSLDWTTLSFGEINYGGRTIGVPLGALSFELLDAPAADGCALVGTGSLAVQLSLTFNATVGRIELRLRVIDPDTGDWPADPFAGILPPGAGACSQGHLTLQLTARADAIPGTLVTNQADIVFDANPAITTNQVWNTLGD
jgi:hypothetical protein